MFLYAESNYFLRIETQELITFRVFYAGSKTEFTNNSLKRPKIGKLNIDALIASQGLLIHEKNPDQKMAQGHLKWDQNELIDEKNQLQKSCETVPLKGQ